MSDEQLEAVLRGLERTPARKAVWSRSAAALYSARASSRVLSERRVLVTQVEPGNVYDLGKGDKLRVLSEGRRGTVLLLEWGDKDPVKSLRFWKTPVELLGLHLFGMIQMKNFLQLSTTCVSM